MEIVYICYVTSLSNIYIYLFAQLLKPVKLKSNTLWARKKQDTWCFIITLASVIRFTQFVFYH